MRLLNLFRVRVRLIWYGVPYVPKNKTLNIFAPLWRLGMRRHRLKLGYEKIGCQMQLYSGPFKLNIITLLNSWFTAKCCIYAFYLFRSFLLGNSEKEIKKRYSWEMVRKKANDLWCNPKVIRMQDIARSIYWSLSGFRKK